MNDCALYRQHDEIALISLNNPPVNALGQVLRGAISDCFTTALKCPQTRAILVDSKMPLFSAGGDIKEFDRPNLPPALPELLNQIEETPVPVIALLNGQVLGGGLELAMATHYRLATADTAFGLPETSIGLVPGAGGTWRTPRLTGVKEALKLIQTGKPIDAAYALEIGLIDKMIARQNPLQSAFDFARQLLARGSGSRATARQPVAVDALETDYFSDIKAKTLARHPHQPAQVAAIDCVRQATLQPPAMAQAFARKHFLQLMKTPQSIALRYAFTAERRTFQTWKNITAEAVGIDRVGVIGGGAMGVGIACCLQRAGFTVRLLEINSDAAKQAQIRFDQNIAAANRYKPAAIDSPAAQTIPEFSVCTDYAQLSNMDLVIEAVFEDSKIKRDVFSALSANCSPDCILATNTSYLDLDSLTGGVINPERCIGMHFFNPPLRMKLLEIIPSSFSSDKTIASTVAIARKLGKLPVRAGNCYGFIGNRMLISYMREAQQLLLEGATPLQVDDAMQQWGMAMGPLAVNDLAGLDIGYKARQARPDLLRQRPNWFCIADSLVEDNRLGRKTGVGFYRYSQHNTRREEAPATLKMIAAARSRFGYSARAIDADEIVWRLTGQLIVAATNILAEKMANSASDIDVVWLHGYGFPRFRGGPMHLADRLGLDTIIEKCRKFQELSGENYWQPPQLLLELAESKSTFAAAFS